MTPQYRIEWISIHDYPRISSLADFARNHWLSKNDTRDPQSLLLHAVAICTAWIDKRLVCCAILTTNGEPDTTKDAPYWLSMCVTDPHWRSHGIFRGLYYQLIDYCYCNRIERIASYSEERQYKVFLQKHGWEHVREAFVDHGWPVDVFVKTMDPKNKVEHTREA